MCGRYASSRDPADLVVEFEIDAGNVKESVQELPDNYNVAPTDQVVAVVERKNREQPDEVVRKLTTVKWGLVPSWAKDPSIGSRLINARMETVAEKPAFKKAFAVRRCILPADGYYEWYESEQKNKSGKPVKQPYFIRPADGGVLAMAGLYEIWRDKTVEDPESDAAWLWTCTVLTTSATDDLGRIHDRMPLLVEPDRYDAWLDPLSSDPDELVDLLIPAAPGRLEAYAVSKAVSSVKNNGPHLVDPLPPDGADPADRPDEPEEKTLF
ncbi:putative SOS response-associated peptidase YedK [Kribbella amoyensis]|uniref:Abasic site processing protein n=1 Tax=Kribbella amoyensis TaxID=996641 RepID=A0A561B7Z6_9ACTN|nr:SOS response-associated peptidase [Kribbella amoyensis]TWD74929.1 putative SOS response-associated peptidase YedK [Kribbella amoyensis]